MPSGALPQSRLRAYSAPPDPLVGFKGPTSKGREGRKDGKEGQGKGIGAGESGKGGQGRKGRGQKGNGGEGEGRVVSWLLEG